ncbi:MAG TPA: pentapeptide repeat-containing protein [Candidatus Saccharimonadales bacterium]|nr:pentapeptide repeat-containing protein [Candidatus Saccharimonadales bacterium]
MKIAKPTLSKDLETVTDIPSFIRNEDSLEDAIVENESFNQQTLKGFSIANTRIVKTDLSEVKINGFSLKDTVFIDSNMAAAKFPNSSWHVIELINSRCTGMQITEGVLKDVLFKGCKLDMVNFRFSKLTNTIFDNCVVKEMDFYNAELKNVKFIDCEIDNVEFSASKLQSVDFTESQIVLIKGTPSLKGAIISNEQLIHLAPYFAAEFGIKVVE